VAEFAKNILIWPVHEITGVCATG